MDLEILYEAGRVPIVERNMICSYIIKTIQRQQASLSECEYVTQCLPPAYKRTYELASTNPSQLGYAPVLESGIIVDNIWALLKWLDKVEPGHLTRKDHQELYDSYNRLLHRQKQVCEDRHIILNDEYAPDDFHGLTSQFDKPVHMDKPLPTTETELNEEMDAYVDDVLKWRKSFEEYGPRRLDTGEIDWEWAHRGVRFIRAFRTLIRPHLDRKWRSDWLMWSKHVHDALDHGLHASMSMSRLQTKVHKTFRGVTREQVDAKALVCLRYFKDFATSMPGGIEFFEYFAQFHAPYRRDLSVRLNPKLSHQS